jgi:hypothetical protein
MLEPHLAEKNTKKKQTCNTLNLQPTQSFSTPRYTEKPGGLPHYQTPAPNLLGRHKPTGKKISGTRYSHSHLWNKSAEPPGQTDPHPVEKKNLKNKQGTEKDMKQRGRGALSAQRRGERQGSLHANFQ